MTKKKSSLRKRSRSGPLFLIFGGLALLALAVVVVALARPPSGFTPEFTGGPSLRVDRQRVDLSDVRLGTPVSVRFTLTNVGDRPLRFNEQPWIEVKEGCWPPEPTVGAAVLQPGESTQLSMSFMMHGDMGGPHDFRVHLTTNAHNNPEIELAVLSNWVP